MASKELKKKRRWLAAVGIAGGLLLTVVTAYLIFVFSSIPFVAHWRRIWIETAMTTGEHQWLATAFFPASTVDEVMAGLNNPHDTVGGGEHLQTRPADPPETDAPVTEAPIPETDTPPETEPVPETEAPAADILGQLSLQVGEPDYAGYRVTVNDVEEGLYITEVTGKGYRGLAMLIDDPARVYVGHTTHSHEGLRMPWMLPAHGAIAGINASGFNDLNGQGTGALPIGKSCSRGVLWGEYNNWYSSIVFTEDNRLVVGQVGDWSAYNIRDGIQSSPVLIADGKALVSGSAGWGIQPRTAIGQREDGVVIFLVIDGRDVTHSIGATVGDLVEIMQRYGAVNAACCDGGSSSVLGYRGQVLNKNTSLNPTLGRRLPNAFLVRPKGE